MCLPLESSTRNGWRELRCTIWLAVPCFPCLACLLCFLHAGQPCPLPAPVITSISHLSCFGVFANERFVEPCKLRRIVIHIQDFHRHGDTAHLRGIVWKEEGERKESQLVAREKKMAPCSAEELNQCFLLLICVKLFFSKRNCICLQVMWLRVKLQMLLYLSWLSIWSHQFQTSSFGCKRTFNLVQSNGTISVTKVLDNAPQLELRLGNTVCWASVLAAWVMSRLFLGIVLLFRACRKW